MPTVKFSPFLGILLMMTFAAIYSNCKSVHLTKHKISISDDIIGVWQEVSETKNNKFEVVKVNDYLAHTISMNDTAAVKEKYTFHQIKQYKFICIELDGGDWLTLNLAEISPNKIVLKEFSFNDEDMESSFGDVPENLKEFTFLATLNDSGINIDGDSWIYERIYKPITE